MLISVQNILGGQLSAISGQCLEIELPLSKSESNRALMILHYAKSQSLRDAETQSVMSDSDDTVLLRKHLDTLDKYLQGLLSVDGCPLTLDCHNAGTVFRFLMTAVANQCIMHNAQFIIDEELSSKQLSNLATQQLSILLTGSERMKSRPISSLVDALRNLGVTIEYTEKEGYPPILIVSTDHEDLRGSLSFVGTRDACDTRRECLIGSTDYTNLRGSLSSVGTRDACDTRRECLMGSTDYTNLRGSLSSVGTRDACDTRRECLIGSTDYTNLRGSLSSVGTRDACDTRRECLIGSTDHEDLRGSLSFVGTRDACDTRRECLIGSTDHEDLRVSLSSSDTSDTRDTRRLEISAEQSSQFASSLLLAAPLWKDGLELHLTGNLSSLPYIDMTINMMRQCGVDVVRNDRDITVKPGRYNIENIKVEPDWSAAAFWYEMVSLSDDAEVLLKNLNINSLQADAAAIKMFESLGVETLPSKEGIVVKKPTANSQQPTANFNFKDCPDLFPSVIAACAGNRVNATFTGLKNLSIKESDRKRAMMNELSKINIAFEDVSDDELKMFCPDELPYFTEENPIIFNNYEDHRIAMALSILSMKIGAISMENLDVVAKSYPGFFKTR